MTNWNPDRVRVDIARDLRAIKDMFDRLREAAIRNANDRDLPGGDAMIMLGPIADIEAFGYRRMSAVLGRTDPDSVEEMLKEDTVPPLLFLAQWSDIVRAARDQPTDLKATIDREVAYLRSSLDFMFSTDADGDMVFLEVEDFANGLHGIVTAMENVLREGERADTGVPCMNCGQALVKSWGDEADEDRWHCRPCDEWSTHDQYMLAVRTDYLKHASWLGADDMEAQWRIPRGTLHSWASRGHVAKRIDVHTGRMLYNVAAALKRRDTLGHAS